MAIFDECLFPVLPLSVTARVHELLELTVGDFIAIDPESRERNRRQNVRGWRARHPNHSLRNGTVRVKCHRNCSRYSEYLIRGSKPCLDGAQPVISPVWYLRKHDGRHAHKLPLRKV